ncbi:MAG: hypothetical protein ABI615_09925 [Chthoniobacterales bacterium]
MQNHFRTFTRQGPDNITEELIVALSVAKSYEFKALFTVIHAALRLRNVANGGEEMLRLRTYEKLQTLVQRGQVRKTGKKYKGVLAPLRLLGQTLRDLRLGVAPPVKPVPAAG